MTDVVVTVPKGLWQEWIEEGDLPGDPWSNQDSYYSFGGTVPVIRPGERVYIVAHNKLRGYAPLSEVVVSLYGRAFVRQGGAVAVTIDEPIRGFRGWRYRWWHRDNEQPFPDWRVP